MRPSQISDPTLLICPTYQACAPVCSHPSKTRVGPPMIRLVFWSAIESSRRTKFFLLSGYFLLPILIWGLGSRPILLEPMIAQAVVIVSLFFGGTEENNKNSKNSNSNSNNIAKLVLVLFVWWPGDPARSWVTSWVRIIPPPPVNLKVYQSSFFLDLDMRGKVLSKETRFSSQRE